jgi:hypothetical protein
MTFIKYNVFGDTFQNYVPTAAMRLFVEVNSITVILNVSIILIIIIFTDFRSVLSLLCYSRTRCLSQLENNYCLTMVRVSLNCMNVYEFTMVLLFSIRL